MVDRERVATDELATALRSLGLQTLPSRSETDLVLDVGGQAVVIEVRHAAYATPERARSVIERYRRRVNQHPDRVHVLVADRLNDAAAVQLDKAGWSWMDRARSRVHLRGPGLFVDADVPPARAAKPKTAEGIVGRGGLAVAFWLCNNPGLRPSPNRDAKLIGVAPSTVTLAMQQLHAAGLATKTGGGQFPELFWELASKWQPAQAARINRPDAGAAISWMAGGDWAALHHGAPIVARGLKPTVFYVDEVVDLSIAVRRFGETTNPNKSYELRVAPIALTAYDTTGHASKGRRVAPVVLTALDIAADAGRGHQILDEWDHPNRVW